MDARKTERMLLKLAKRFADIEIIRNMSEWPPKCLSVLHQPRRPQKRLNSSIVLKYRF